MDDEPPSDVGTVLASRVPSRPDTGWTPSVGVYPSLVEHGYIENDFDVDEWAAPEFLEQAAKEVLAEEWAKRSWTKLPEVGTLEVNDTRLG